MKWRRVIESNVEMRQKFKRTSKFSRQDGLRMLAPANSDRIDTKIQQGSETPHLMLILK